uniref:Uncharacterized protein n=1 Tax=Panagrolaimus davidi TaxID=227884 RepID=A0A914PBM9_9BILA
MLESNFAQLKSNANGILQWNANIGQSTNQNSKFCLFRDSSGYLSIKDFGPNNSNLNNDVCCLRFNQNGVSPVFHPNIYGGSYSIYSTSVAPSTCQGCASRKQTMQNDEIIAPVILSADNFSLDNQCKTEFV